MDSFDIFRSRMRNKGKSLRDAKIKSSRQNLENVFMDDPSYRSHVEIIGKPSISARIDNYRKEGFLQPKMDIQATMNNEFDQGDLLRFDEQYWLCTMKHSQHDIHFIGEVIQCNNILRFQLPNSYDIHEYYVVAERPYTKNLTTGMIVRISDKEYRVRMQLTDVTRKLHLKQRFMMGMGYDEQGREKPDVYTIDSRDGISNAVMMEEGFLILNLVEDQYKEENDNKELMIADYREPPQFPVITPNKCIIRNDADELFVKLGENGWKEFNCDIYDENSQILDDISNIDFRWNVTATDVQKSVLDIYEYEENFKIKCNGTKDQSKIPQLIGSSFTISVSAFDNVKNIEYSSDKVIIKIKGLI